MRLIESYLIFQIKDDMMLMFLNLWYDAHMFQSFAVSTEFIKKN